MSNSLQFLLYILGVVIRIPFQLRKSQKLLNPIINKVENEKGRIISKVKNKTKSFSILLPLSVYRPYSRLVGKENKKDDDISLFISALTCPYDYYLDNTNDPDSVSQLSKIMSSPYDSDCSDPIVEFIRRLYIEIIERLEPHQKKPYLNILVDLHKAQLKSAYQQNEDVTPNQLMNASKEKGGLSMLAYTGFVKEQYPDEIEALKLLGAWFQLVDDYSDIERDVEKDIKTYFTEAPLNIHKSILDLEITNAIEATKKLSYDPQKINRYLFELISFSILGTTFYEQLRMGNKLVKWSHKKGPLSAISVLFLGSIYAVRNISGYSPFQHLQV